MIELTDVMACNIRETRARSSLTINEASKQIGISSKTLSYIEKARVKRIKKTVYVKIVDWLLKNKKR